MILTIVPGRAGARFAWAFAATLGVLLPSEALADQRVADAIERRDAVAFDRLLAGRADVNGAQPDGATALHWAAHWDDLQVVERLLRAGGKVNAANENGVTPLSLACENGNGPVALRLLDAGANPNAALLTGETPLMMAARTGNAQVVEALVARGADVNAREKTRRQTALMWATSRAHPSVTRVLIGHGADVHARSTSGFTPLLFAARQGDVESAQLLVEAGADINQADPDGSTPLLVATASAQEAVAIWLVNHGANPNRADVIGYTPLHAVVWKPSAKEGLVRPDGSVDLVDTLLAHGANQNAEIVKDPPPVAGSYRFETGLVGATPYWLAAKTADAAVMRRLAAAGSNIEKPNRGGTTPLMVAAGVGQAQGPGSIPEGSLLRGVEAAVALGGNVNATNAAGQTAIHGAAGSGFNKIIQYLVDHGANPNVKDRRGQTPLDVAMRRKDALQSTIELLQALVAKAAAGRVLLQRPPA